MSNASPGEMRTLLAAAFENRGWEYDLVTGKAIIERAERDGRVDPPALAGVVPNSFLQRNGASREDVAAAIAGAIGGRTPRPAEPTTTTITINDNRYSLNLGAGAQIAGSQVNVGGTQINVQAGADKNEVLSAVSALLQAGLEGDWNPEAAADLAQAIDARDDIGVEDIQGVATEIAAESEPDRGRVREILDSIAAQGIGGALGTGIAAGFGWLLQNPPI